MNTSCKNTGNPITVGDYRKGKSDADSAKVDEMNRAQYHDELVHKMKVYNEVKATLKLCQTMIRSMEPTSDAERSSKSLLESHLLLADNFALLAETDVRLEIGGIK